MISVTSDTKMIVLPFAAGGGGIETNEITIQEKELAR